MSPRSHPRMYQLMNRQDDPSTLSSVEGLGGISTQTSAALPTGTGIAIDTSAKPFTPTFAAPTSVTRSSSSVSPSPTPAAASPSASSGSSSDIPIGTVVGACVGAFLGAALLIGIGLYFYRRSAPATHDTRSFSKLGAADTKSGHGREKEDAEDKWDGNYPPQAKKYQTDLPHTLPTTLPKSPADDKLNMFQTKSLKSSPSISSSNSHDHTGFTSDGHAVLSELAAYNPGLAEQLAVGTTQGGINSQSTPNLHQARPFAGRIDNQPPVSWDGETVGNFSMRSSSQYDLRTSSQIVNTDFKSSGAMSPSLVMAIPTPAATSTVHRWESAEVEHFEENDNAPVQPNIRRNNPFIDSSADDDETPRPSFELNRSSRSNPFFNAQDDGFNARKRSISSKSEMSNGEDSAYVERARENAKGKQRARAASVSTVGSARSSATVEPGSNNPFTTYTVPPVPSYGEESPRPLPTPSPAFHAQHNSSLSADSTVDPDKAIRSLIAALDIKPAQRESLSSQYTDATEGANNGWAIESPSGFQD